MNHNLHFSSRWEQREYNHYVRIHRIASSAMCGGVSSSSINRILQWFFVRLRVFAYDFGQKWVKTLLKPRRVVWMSTHTWNNVFHPFVVRIRNGANKVFCVNGWCEWVKYPTTKYSATIRSFLADRRWNYIKELLVTLLIILCDVRCSVT